MIDHHTPLDTRLEQALGSVSLSPEQRRRHLNRISERGNASRFSLSRLIRDGAIVVVLIALLAGAWAMLPLGGEPPSPGTSDLVSPGEGVPTLTNLGTIDDNYSYTGATIGEIEGHEYAFIAITLHDGIEIHELNPEGDHSRVSTIDLQQGLDPATVENPQGLFAMAVAEGWLYVAMPSDDEPTIRAYDVSDPSEPSNPVEIVANTGKVSGSWVPPRLFATGDGTLAAVDIANDTMLLFDISQPQEPVVQTTHPIGHRDAPVAVEIVDSRIYLTYASAVEIIDISESGSPELLGTLENQYLEGADDVSSIDALKASETANEALNHSVSADRFLNIAVAGDLAYIALGGQRLVVADISNPVSPEEIAVIERDDQPTAGHVVGEFLFLYEIEAVDDTANDTYELTSAIRALEISNPTEPREIESLESILPAVELGRVYNFLGFPHAGEGFHIVQEPNGVHVLRINWREDSGEATDVETTPTDDADDVDPNEAVEAMQDEISEPEPGTPRYIEIEGTGITPGAPDGLEEFTVRAWERWAEDGSVERAIHNYSSDGELVGRVVELIDRTIFETPGNWNETTSGAEVYPPRFSPSIAAVQASEPSEQFNQLEQILDEEGVIIEDEGEGKIRVWMPSPERLPDEDLMMYEQLFGVQATGWGVEHLLDTEANRRLEWRMYVEDDEGERHTLQQYRFDGWHEIDQAEIPDDAFAEETELSEQEIEIPLPERIELSLGTLEMRDAEMTSPSSGQVTYVGPAPLLIEIRISSHAGQEFDTSPELAHPIELDAVTGVWYEDIREPEWPRRATWEDPHRRYSLNARNLPEGGWTEADLYEVIESISLDEASQ